jgi:hypothetical protein
MILGKKNGDLEGGVTKPPQGVLSEEQSMCQLESPRTGPSFKKRSQGGTKFSFFQSMRKSATSHSREASCSRKITRDAKCLD